MLGSRLITTAGIAAALLAAAGVARADGLHFDLQVLPKSVPGEQPFYDGGEPSLSFDPTGDGHVYIAAPQGLPSALDSGDEKVGVAFWGSDDGGRTWPVALRTGVGTGGGDSDVEVGIDHSVYVLDLEAVATAICTSHDFGRTFPGCGDVTGGEQEGPDNDRQWLTHGPENELYLVYHDFVGGYPRIYVSTDGGMNYLPCGTIINPLGPAAAQYSPKGSTLVSKPVVKGDGTIYLEFSTPGPVGETGEFMIRHMYMATAKECTGTTIFENYEIYSEETADLGNIFQQVGLDGGGQLYVLAAGSINGADVGSHIYLFTSVDEGKTWSKPVRIDPPELKANVFPTIAGGLGAGTAVLTWFGSKIDDDPNAVTNEWRVYAATTYDGGQTFETTTVTPDFPMHLGQICTQGLFCSTGGDRSLLDFANAGVNPKDGCALLALPGNPDGGSASAYAARQDGGRCLTDASAGTPAGGTTPAQQAACLDRVAPVATRPKLRIRRGRLVARGRASDRGCGAGGNGSLKRVLVSVARLDGRRCRYVRSNGRLGKLRSCSRPLFVRARGLASWSFTPRRRLHRGRYVIRVRAIDAAGNTSTTRSAARRVR